MKISLLNTLQLMIKRKIRSPKIAPSHYTIKSNQIEVDKFTSSLNKKTGKFNTDNLKS